MRDGNNRVGARDTLRGILEAYPAEAIEAATERIRRMHPGHPALQLLESWVHGLQRTLDRSRS